MLLVALAPFADELFDADDIEQAILAAALLPLVQASENVGATALLLHSRYDLRSVYQAGFVGPPPARDRHRCATSASSTALVAIVVAQAISTFVDLPRRGSRR